MLSIIIPTLNEEKVLPKLLKSIEKQDFDDYEIIVADAGSEDKTKKIAEDYGCKIIKGGLPSKGRNEGAEKAQGELLLFVDADEVLTPNFLSKALKKFKEKNLDMAAFPFSFYDQGKFMNFLANVFGVYTLGFALEKILPHATGVILVKKEIHNKIGGFDEEIKLAEDHIYAREASKVGKYGILKSVRFLDSSRRFQRDGWFKTYIKYILAEFYMIFFGPIKSDIFSYKFNHYDR